MAWVVDTCLILDVLEDDPEFGLPSSRLLDRRTAEGLTICPVTFVELAPAFDGELERQSWFLRQIGIAPESDWQWRDTEQAFAAWHRHVTRKRRGEAPRRPIADMLIGAFATRFQGLLTRNAADFRAAFPQLRMEQPRFAGPTTDAFRK